MKPVSSANQSEIVADVERVGKRAFVKRLAGACAAVASSAALPATEPTKGAPADLRTPAAAAREREVSASDTQTVVEISTGKLRGCNRSGIYVFKGVPYGESTGGENRFRAPQPPTPWTGIRNALQFGHACMQPATDSAHFNYDGHNTAGSEEAFLMHGGAGKLNPGEDCLQLNVWTPSIRDRAKRPVMVFMHGGGFEGGFDNDLASYDGENLARNDVVVVTHNHRLNLFGYLNLVDNSAGKYTANAGLLDLVAVLTWVREHIADFGGDAGNVTIFGQSGGGGKVLCLMAMPAAKGLFHRAIVQSGPYLKMQSREASVEITAEVLRQLGLSATQLDSLQRTSVDRLVGAGAEAMKKLMGPKPIFHRVYGTEGWQPVVDGTVLPRHPFDPGAPLESANVPLLTGTIFNEITSALNHPIGNAMSETELQQGIRDVFGDRSPAIIAAYRRDYPHATPFGIFGAIAAEPFRRASQEQAARKAALGGGSAYVYLYAWRTPMLDDRPGTFHAADLAFTFDNAQLCDHYSGVRPDALAFAKRISAAWVAFARSGNPNHAGLPHWAPFDRENAATMVFDNRCELRPGLEREALALIAAS
jgi:para-nitrobenzyl esterase